MGNPIPPGDGLAPLVDKLGAQDRRLRELETFDATQYARAIEELKAQQTHLASLYTRAASGEPYNAASIPGDSTNRFVDSDAAVTVAASTGRVLVTVGASVVRVRPGNSSAEGFVTFSISRPGEDPWWPAGTRAFRVWSAAERNVGVGGSGVYSVDVAPGVDYEYRLALGTWSASATDLASIFIDSPSIAVQVIPGD